MAGSSGHDHRGTCGIDRNTFQQLARLYRRRWKVGLCAITAEGRVVLAAGLKALAGPGQTSTRKLAVDEALRWGEPAVEQAFAGRSIWAAPPTQNARLLGGLVAGVSEAQLFPRGINAPAFDVRAACADLLHLAETHNLTNAALLETRRRESHSERVRAEAIHAFKAGPHYDLRALYLVEEPLLISAIRRGDRGAARAILNRLLVGMIHRSGGQLELTKSYFMELVAMMSRTAVESGGAAEALLGSGFASLGALAEVRDDLALASWLRDMHARIVDSLGRHTAQSDAVLLSSAMRFMSEHCGEHLSREDAAKVAAMSPAHFSRRFKEHFGRTFSEVLLRLRTDRAADLLLRSDRPLKIVAIECGFADQSYLTKVFHRRFGVTPARYRREHQMTKA